MLRKKYHRLLPADGIYHKDNMFVLSSYAERCLMSAQGFLAGFLPPNEKKNLLPITWQPVAINSVPRDRDKVRSNQFLLFQLKYYQYKLFQIISQKMNCDKYDRMLAKMYFNPDGALKEFNKKYASTYEYISKHSGAVSNFFILYVF